MVHALAQTDGREQTADKGPVETQQLMVHIARSSARVTGTTRSCAILGRAVAFASPVTLGTTATDLVLCTLTVEIAETCAIAKTMPFVTQPTESALAHRDSWAKNAIENVHKDSMAKDANISADAKMEQSVMRRAENATVSQVGLGFFAIHLVLLVDTDKIARRNVTVKMERLVVILQASVNVWPVSKVAIVRCLVIAGVTALDVPIDALVIMPTLTDAIQSMESVFANMAGKVFNVNPYVKLDVMVQTANSNVIVETMEVLAKLNQVAVFASKDTLVLGAIDLVPKVFMVLDVNKHVFLVPRVMGLAII